MISSWILDVLKMFVGCCFKYQKIQGFQKIDKTLDMDAAATILQGLF